MTFITKYNMGGDINTKRKLLVIYCIAFVIVPICAGAVLYYIFCKDVWFVKVIDGWLGIINRPKIDFSSYPVLRFLRNYAFDFIWAFSMTNALFIISDNNAKQIHICATIPVVLGSTMEFLQLLGIAGGTFDAADIATEVLGTGLSAIIISIFRRHLNEKQN